MCEPPNEGRFEFAAPVQHDVVGKEGRGEQLNDPDWKPQHQQDDGAEHNLEGAYTHTHAHTVECE